MALGIERKRAWVALVVAHVNLVDRVTRRMDEAGVVPWESYNVLLALEEAEGGHLRLGELARTVGLTPSGATRLVDRLEKVGLVARVLCPTDRRAVHAQITPDGRAARAAAWPIYEAAVDEVLTVSDGDAKKMADLLVPLTGDRPMVGV